MKIKMILVLIFVGISQIIAETYLYVSSYTGIKLQTYKILENGTLENINKDHNLCGKPKNMGKYSYMGNNYLFVACSNNKLAVYKMFSDGGLNLLNEYMLYGEPDAISSVYKDKYLYVSSSKTGLITGFQLKPDTGELIPTKGSPYNIGGSAFGYSFSPNGRYMYMSYTLENKVGYVGIKDDTGEVQGADESSKLLSASKPGRYSIFNGDLYVLGVNGISRYTIEADDTLKSANRYQGGTLDYTFNFAPTRMTDHSGYLYFTDTGNKLNIFKINQDATLLFVEQIDMQGKTDRGLSFYDPTPYVYQPVYGGDKINQYLLDKATGKLKLINSYPGIITPFQMVIVSW